MFAAGGTSADASPAYLAAARTEAEVRGYADRVTYFGGDFVERAAEIEPADLVTLDRVVCCYPDMPAMLGAAAPLTRRALGLVFPRGTRFIRSGDALVNLIQRLRRHPFRVFVHDPAEIEAVLKRHGLSQRYLRDGFLWRVVVFGRDATQRDSSDTSRITRTLGTSSSSVSMYAMSPSGPNASGIRGASGGNVPM